MRLLPRSLFSRIVLVLLSGLVIAQLLSLAIHMHERGELLSRASGMQSAQRIADIVKLLDSLNPAERQRIAAILSAPPLVITLGQRALAPQAEDPERNAHATLFGAMLRRFLGGEWQVEVAVTESMPFKPPSAMHGFKGPGKGAAKMPFNPAMRYFSQPGLSFVAQVRLRDGTLVTFDSRQPAETMSWPYRLLLSLVILLAAVIGVSLVAVRWATRPLNALADAAEELGKNINRPPLEEKGPLEVARAARAFNTMQARLIHYIRDRTRVLAAMSHDLKTPITRLRLRSELLDDPQLRAKLTKDLDEMESMVGATLDFMRGLENEEPVKPVDIMALLESLQADMLEMGGRIKIAGMAHRPYRGKPQALKRCLSNLLDNAIKYGKSALILVDDDNTRLEIRIQDEGPGIAAPELERVFEPFYRLEDSRNRETGGTGLGLTIARSIAQNHGGKLTLRNRAGGGLEASLTLPHAGASVSKTHEPP